jgi:hypothetical protein
MTSALQQRLAGIGLPASVRDQLVHTAGQGARGSAFSRPLPAAVRAALNATFVDGLHIAECAGAIVLASTALFAAILARRAQQPQPPGRGPLQTRPRTNTCDNCRTRLRDRAPYPRQRLRVVYRRSGGSGSGG